MAGQAGGLVASDRVRAWEKAAGPQGVVPREVADQPRGLVASCRCAVAGQPRRLVASCRCAVAGQPRRLVASCRCAVSGQPRGLVASGRVRGVRSAPGACGVVPSARWRVRPGGSWHRAECGVAGQAGGLVASDRVRAWEKAAGPQGVVPREGRRCGVNRASKEDPTGDRLSKWSRARSEVTWHPTTVPISHDHGASTSPNGASRSTRP